METSLDRRGPNGIVARKRIPRVKGISMFRKSILSSTAVLALVAAIPASADVTAVQAWEDFKALYESMGQSVETADEVMSGDTLTITGFNAAVVMPEGEGDVSGGYDEVVFTERSDGTVAITMSETYALNMDFESDTGERITGGFDVKHPGMTIIASGDPGATRYDFVAPEITVDVSELLIDGQPMPVKVTADMASVTGNYQVTEGVPRAVTSTVSAAQFNMAMSADEIDGSSDSFSFNFSLADLAGTSEGTAIDFTSMLTLSQMLDAGFVSNGAFTYGQTSYEMSGTDSGDTFNVVGSAASGDFDVSVGPDGVSYGGGNTDLNVSVSGSDIPLPQINFKVAESEGRLKMPMAPSDEPQDFGLLMRMVDLEIDDFIWSMFDPTGALGRDPATVVLDLSGAGRWIMDITDPEAAADFSGDAPGELTSLDLNALQVTVAGADLTGTGAFTFDNEAVGAFPGMPAADGAIDLQLVGANGLLDKLVELGLLPDDQAMGARMMLGLFARPGEGPDTLVSKIEVTPDGGVSANGQRIR